MSLTVRRLKNVFVAGKDLPRARETCARLKSSVEQRGLEHLARTLDQTLNPADPSVWVIRRLRVSFVIVEPKECEDRWANGVSRGIKRHIELGADGGNALHFPDRAAYWAWFLGDRAGGSPARDWYGSLASLQHLEFGAASLTLLSRQPELTARVLARLFESDSWERALLQWSESQATRLLDWISPGIEIAPASLLARAAEAFISASSLAHGPQRTCLSAVTRLLSDFPDAPPTAVRDAVETIAATRDVFRTLPSETWARLIDAQWAWSARGAPSPISVPSRVSLLLGQLPLETINELVRTWQLQAEYDPPKFGTFSPTEFGGWFLLLESYISLDIESLVDPPDCRALRWLLARMCLGPRGRTAPEDDPGLLWAAGLELPPAREHLPTPREGAVKAWLAERNVAEIPDSSYFGESLIERAWAPVAIGLIRCFAQRLPGFAHSSPTHLDRNIFVGRSSIQFSPAGIEVSIAARPLDILLRMSGFDGLSYELPWRDYVKVKIRLV